MSVTIDIPPIPGVPEELLIAINDRLRRLDTETAGASALTVYGTRLEREDRYKAADYALGTVYRETDTGLRYQNEQFQGAPQWVYLAGVHIAAFANRLTGLSALDDGLIWNCSDHEHLLRWNGSGWAFLDTQGGYIAGHTQAATGAGWVLCNGGATSYLTITAGVVAQTAFVTPNIAIAGFTLASYANAYVGIVAAALTAAAGAATWGYPAHIPRIPYFRR